MNFLRCPLSLSLCSQVQSIKQNNSSLKQSLTEGVDTLKPAEVNLCFIFIHSLLDSSFLRTLACLHFLICPCPLACSLYTSHLPQDIISPLAALRLVLIVPLLLSLSHLSCLRPPFHPHIIISAPQPVPKMNSRWTTEEQLLAVQGE